MENGDHFKNGSGSENRISRRSFIGKTGGLMVGSLILGDTMASKKDVPVKVFEANTMLRKANVSYRIRVQDWFDDEAFAKTVAELEAQRGGFDEVALFSGVFASVSRLDLLARNIDGLRRRYPELRKHGWSAGVNLQSLVGHQLDGIKYMVEGYTNFTGIDGRTSPGTCCPNDPAFREEYIAPLMRMHAESQPDFIWLEDDIRYAGHDPVSLVCFCDHCMAMWNARQGASYTRDTLNEAFQSGTVEERLVLRRDWLAFSGESLISLFKFATEHVHAVSPTIEMGAMDAGRRSGDTADYILLAEALKGKGKTPRFRPGGGAYTDYRMDDFLDKAHQLGTEAALLPDEVVNIQSEVENYIYERLAKSSNACAMEACVYNAAGCTGAAWAVPYTVIDTWSVFRPLMSKLTAIRPFMDLQVATNGRLRPLGIYNGRTPAFHAGAVLGGQGVNPHYTGLFAAGVPPAYRLQDAQMTILNGTDAWTLNTKELETILSRGLYCDVETVRILEQRGFGSDVGFKVGKELDFYTYERYSERYVTHPFNEGFTGLLRHNFQRFEHWSQKICLLEPMDAGCESLMELVNVDNEAVAPYSLGIYENTRGGRVAVATYYPLNELLFCSKTTQLKRLFRWLSRDTLTAWVDSYHRIALWVRETGTSSRALSFVNASLDPAEKAELMVKTAIDHGTLTDMDMKSYRITGVDVAGGYVKFTLPTLDPWKVYLFKV